MKNFIRFNIENVKGRKPVSIIDREPRTLSNQKTKPRYGFHQHRSIENRVQQLESELTHVADRKTDSILLEEISEIKRDIKLIKSHLFGQKASKMRM